MDSFIPPDLDWPVWVARWDRMQERYLVNRAERFEIIAQLIHGTQGPEPRLLDLGCGAGSLMLAILEVIPGATVVGVDMDPTLLWLAQARLAKFAARAQLVQADLREAGWANTFSLPPSGVLREERDGVRANAIVSAAALHWLSPEQLSSLYVQLGQLLLPGGIFLNADHVGSDDPRLQQSWEHHREEMRARQSRSDADDWDVFWNAYLAAIGPEAAAAREQALGEWQGVEDGMPLAWHFAHLRQAGFAAVDCFWRCDCDAIYGGILH